MIAIRLAVATDEDFWLSLDTHLPKERFFKKVAEQTAYVLIDNGQPIGLLRYNFSGIRFLFVRC